MTIRRALIIAAALICVAAPASAKLKSPLQGRVVPAETKAAVGTTVPIALTLTTAQPFKAVDVAIQLPPGVELTEGTASTEIADFKPGEKKVFRYKVRVTQVGEQVVMVTARAKHLDPHEGWGNTFVTVINGNQ